LKYNSLANYRAYLAGWLAPSTASTYHAAMTKLLEEQNIMNVKDFDISLILEQLREVKYKNQFSKYKNAFFLFCEYIERPLSLDEKIAIESMGQEKIKKRRRLKVIKLEDITNKIRVIRDKKLRYSFETMLKSGLRVSEISQIRKEDCVILDDIIIFNFVGKGQRKESVTILASENKSLYASIKKMIKETPQGEKVFYSVSHLQKEATKRGFSCHYLRRGYAKMKYKEVKNITEVQKALRHSNKRTTKIYLKSKLKI
jgi:integrase